MAGGVMAELQGGSFGHGFLAAGITKAVNVNDRVGVAENLASARVIVAALIGGTVSEMTGGEFANGAITAAMAQVLNGEQDAQRRRDLTKQLESRGAPITDEQRALAEDGDYVGFWKSRYLESGDPVARTALIGWGHGKLVGASWWERSLASYTWNRLQSFIAENELTITMEEVGMKLARAHVDAVTKDTVRVHHLLSPTQVANYHHDVFRPIGIPDTYFGGTRFGALDPYLYSWAWCGGCDTRP
jgi:hypothetical protein